MNYNILTDEKKVQSVIAELGKRGVAAELVQNRTEALEKVKSLIPSGKEVMTGGSLTLEQIGFIDLLKSGQHEWKNWKDMILAEKDPAKQNELRKKSVTSEFFLGSVHAVSKSGQLVVVSGTASQIPSYAFTSPNVIWVVGTQKIVPTLEDGMARAREYCLPMNDARIKASGGSGTAINHWYIFEKNISPRNLHMIFVNEVLGF